MLEAGRPDAATPEPWKAFLKALDESLSDRVELHCMGGFVVTLLYGLSRETSDMDVLTAVPHQRLTELQTFAGQGSALHRRFLPAGAGKQDLTMQLWVEMCWPRNI